MLEKICKDEVLDNLLKLNIIRLTEWFHRIISNEVKKELLEKIELTNKYLQLMNLVFEGKNMGFYHERMMRSYLDNARNYAKTNMIDEAIDNLLEGINHAIKLEASTITKYEQLLLNGIIDDT